MSLKLCKREIRYIRLALRYAIQYEDEYILAYDHFSKNDADAKLARRLGAKNINNWKKILLRLQGSKK